MVNYISLLLSDIRQNIWGSYVIEISLLATAVCYIRISNETEYWSKNEISKRLQINLKSCPISFFYGMCSLGSRRLEVVGTCLPLERPFLLAPKYVRAPVTQATACQTLGFNFTLTMTEIVAPFMANYCLRQSASIVRETNLTSFAITDV